MSYSIPSGPQPHHLCRYLSSLIRGPFSSPAGGGDSIRAFHLCAAAALTCHGHQAGHPSVQEVVAPVYGIDVPRKTVTVEGSQSFEQCTRVIGFELGASLDVKAVDIGELRQAPQTAQPHSGTSGPTLQAQP